MYWAGFTQHQAAGASLAVLLPPIGLAAAIEYYRQGNVNVHAAIILAITMFTGSWRGGPSNKTVTRWEEKSRLRWTVLWAT
jgi:hypothetical protein